MSLSEIPPLDDDLVALLERERRAEPFPRPGARERGFDAVMKRVAAESAAAAAPPVTPRSRSVATVLGALGLLALGALLGALATNALGRHALAPSPSAGQAQEIVYVPIAVPVGYPARAEPPDAPPPAAGASQDPLRTKPSASATSATGDRLAAERRLLDGARVALASGEPTDALALAERHRASFPAGALVEEREAIATKALVEAHRHAEARARGAAFERRFPESPLLRSVRSSLATIDAKP